MASLLTLTEAKEHLRITTDDTSHDSDVYTKAQEASAIILDYLTERANNAVAILTSSVGSPTTITTAGLHGFTSGASVTIAGHTNSLVNGTWVATVVTSTTFTVPRSVSDAGAGGTAAVLWTDATAPFPVKAATKLYLTHLYEKRGDDPETDEQLWMAIGRVLVRSRDAALA